MYKARRKGNERPLWHGECKTYAAMNACFGKTEKKHVLIKMGASSSTVRNLGLNKPKSCPEDFMGAVRFLRVCRSPLKWLEL